MDINAETLREIRESKGLSQSDFAESIGLKFRSYQNYELGHPIPETKKELIRLKLNQVYTKNSEDYTNNVQTLNEAEEKYNNHVGHYKIKEGNYKEVIELGLRTVANWDQLKQLDIVKNCIELDILKAELHREKEKSN